MNEQTITSIITNGPLIREIATKGRWVADQNRTTRNQLTGKAALVVSATDDAIVLSRPMHDDEGKFEIADEIEVEDGNLSLTIPLADFPTDPAGVRDMVVALIGSVVNSERNPHAVVNDDEAAALAESGVSQRQLRERIEGRLLSLCSAINNLDPVARLYFDTPKGGMNPLVAVVQDGLKNGWKPTDRVRQKLDAAIKSCKDEVVLAVLRTVRDEIAA